MRPIMMEFWTGDFAQGTETLVARHLKTTEDLFDSRSRVPESLTMSGPAVQGAERIISRTDGAFANSADDERRWLRA
jgi:hypothetical protein